MLEVHGTEPEQPVRLVMRGSGDAGVSWAAGGVRTSGLAGRGEAAFVLGPDGSVTIPAPLAREVVRALVRDLTARVRADGGEVSPAVRGIVRALHEAAAWRPDEGGSGGGTPVERAASVQEVTTEQAAELLGCSTRYVRRLAGSGRVAARRAGPVWLIDRASLDAFRTGGVA
ncbi:helix-turn-helix domain-containing protein [Streptomyces indiaensis]|uniref:Helix-turn-helix domain-containing protein n=2 Tax=Streptomyces indiaensis TaxID=284033 RepID=A0ABN3D442_9ACTN|nr:helix-turn-helix domain-containing protein [Streptomyces indiaensis]